MFNSLKKVARCNCERRVGTNLVINKEWTEFRDCVGTQSILYFFRNFSPKFIIFLVGYLLKLADFKVNRSLSF